MTSRRSALSLGMAFLGLPAALSGCGAISALDAVSTPLDVYELRPPAVPAEAARGGRIARDVIVEVPTSAGSLDTDRIMIRPNPLQAEYLPEARWSESTPVMVQTLMLRSLEATNRLRYVGRRPLGAGGDVAILTEIQDFQAELAPDGKTAQVHMRLRVTLVRENDARILSTRTFATRAAAASTKTLPVVEAFDAAAQQILADFTVWTMANLR